MFNTKKIKRKKSESPNNLLKKKKKINRVALYSTLVGAVSSEKEPPCWNESSSPRSQEKEVG